MIVNLKKSDKPGKKFVVDIYDSKRPADKVYFGDSDYEDYTTHRDDNRKERYITRHKSREDWTKKGI